uniref:Uncharacterized protein n=1 Tax=Gorilla gorilla gorilla TaxID=9595 RepID=G3R7C8_GORGO
MMATLAPILWYAPGFAHQISSPLALHLLLSPDSHLPIIMDTAPGCAGLSGTIWSSSWNLGLVEWEWGRGLHWANLESTVIPSIWK